jgi:hypothetical protein
MHESVLWQLEFPPQCRLILSLLVLPGQLPFVNEIINQSFASQNPRQIPLGHFGLTLTAAVPARPGAPTSQHETKRNNSRRIFALDLLGSPPRALEPDC